MLAGHDHINPDFHKKKVLFRGNESLFLTKNNIYPVRNILSDVSQTYFKFLLDVLPHNRSLFPYNETVLLSEGFLKKILKFMESASTSEGVLNPGTIANLCSLLASLLNCLRKINLIEMGAKRQAETQGKPSQLTKIFLSETDIFSMLTASLVLAKRCPGSGKDILMLIWGKAFGGALSFPGFHLTSHSQFVDVLLKAFTEAPHSVSIWKILYKTLKTQSGFMTFVGTERLDLLQKVLATLTAATPKTSSGIMIAGVRFLRKTAEVIGKNRKRLKSNPSYKLSFRKGEERPLQTLKVDLVPFFGFFAEKANEEPLSKFIHIMFQRAKANYSGKPYSELSRFYKVFTTASSCKKLHKVFKKEDDYVFVNDLFGKAEPVWY